MRWNMIVLHLMTLSPTDNPFGTSVLPHFFRVRVGVVTISLSEPALKRKC